MPPVMLYTFEKPHSCVRYCATKRERMPAWHNTSVGLEGSSSSPSATSSRHSSNCELSGRAVQHQPYFPRLAACISRGSRTSTSCTPPPVGSASNAASTISRATAGRISSTGADSPPPLAQHRTLPAPRRAGLTVSRGAIPVAGERLCKSTWRTLAAAAGCLSSDSGGPPDAAQQRQSTGAACRLPKADTTLYMEAISAWCKRWRIKELFISSTGGSTQV
mmetsp:Transcript_26389/g.66361  ORF Transcript_26389/g.66361 Transcript_26389/m.66361 type:complete len:220 (-) Transcript_26389:106-765(-)